MSHNLVDSSILTTFLQQLGQCYPLEAYFSEIFPQLESYSQQTNPDAFQRKFSHFKTQISKDQGSLGLDAV